MDKIEAKYMRLLKRHIILEGWERKGREGRGGRGNGEKEEEGERRKRRERKRREGREGRGRGEKEEVGGEGSGGEEERKMVMQTLYFSCTETCEDCFYLDHYSDQDDVSFHAGRLLPGGWTGEEGGRVQAYVWTWGSI